MYRAVRPAFSELVGTPPVRSLRDLQTTAAEVPELRQVFIQSLNASRAGGQMLQNEAVEEARAFLSERPYVTADEAQRTFVEHRSWR